MRRFQQRLFAGYTQSLALPEPYHYLYGNPVQPVVPLDTAQDRILIIGAYPSARFAAIQRVRDVPVGDNCGPFSTERYFDGQRVRTVNSGAELEQQYLTPLGIDRSQCWITDLVRVFLFKPGHILKYRQLGCTWPAHETRSHFESFAEQGLAWLEEEVRIARPKVIITLGSEVAGILQGVRGQAKRNNLLDGDIHPLQIEGRIYPAIHMAHPGILMRSSDERNLWYQRHHMLHLPAVRDRLVELMPRA
jgi:hypothetical protein